MKLLVVNLFPDSSESVTKDNRSFYIWKILVLEKRSSFMKLVGSVPESTSNNRKNRLFFLLLEIYLHFVKRSSLMIVPERTFDDEFGPVAENEFEPFVGSLNVSSTI